MYGKNGQGGSFSWFGLPSSRIVFNPLKSDVTGLFCICKILNLGFQSYDILDLYTCGNELLTRRIIANIVYKRTKSAILKME